MLLAAGEVGPFLLRFLLPRLGVVDIKISHVDVPATAGLFEQNMFLMTHEL
jgi:hypothetical protein